MLENVNAISNYENLGVNVGTGSYQVSSDGDTSIFLEARFEEIKHEQGVLGNFWNGVKEFTNLGQSESDCESMLEKYNDGEVSFEEALEYLNDYEVKQNNMSELQSNILTGVGAIAAATAFAAGAPISAAAVALGGGVGATLKTTINTIDRATNEIYGDEFDAKEIAKDAITGAVTGATSAVSSGVKAGIKAGSAALSIGNGAKCGAICGAVSGSSSYLTDVAFGDTEFNFGDLTSSTLTSSIVSGTVGGIVGGGMYGGAKVSGNVGAIASDSSKDIVGTIVEDSSTSTARKVLGHAERSLIAAV